MVEVCLEKQQLLIDDFRNRIKNLLESEGLGNEEEYDSTVQAGAAQRTSEVRLLNEQMDFAAQELSVLIFLTSIETVIHERAELGSVVVTDAGTFFISVSIEQFRLGNKRYVGISIHSPLYLAMKGKRKGESFVYEKKNYHILDIF